jgi:hypothetical protein
MLMSGFRFFGFLFFRRFEVGRRRRLFYSLLFSRIFTYPAGFRVAPGALGAVKTAPSARGHVVVSLYAVGRRHVCDPGFPHPAPLIAPRRPRGA